MSNKAFRISGRIVDTTTGRAIPGLKVEAWDKDMLFDDFVGSARSGPDGKFLIEFTEGHFQECFGDRRPDLYFRVFYEGRLFASSEESAVWNVAAPDIVVVIEMALPALPPDAEPALPLSKPEALELGSLAHLSLSELEAKKPQLAATLRARLEERARRKAIARLGGVSETLRKLLAKIRIVVDRAPEKTTLREAAVLALRELVSLDPALAGDAKLANELDELQKSASAPVGPGAKPDVTLAESLGLGQALAFHPEFRKQLDAAKLFRLSDATGLGDKVAESLIREVGKPTDITERRLEALVKGQKLSADEARAAGFAVSLYNLLDERPELVAAAKAGINDVRELVKNDKAAWAKLVKESKTKPPGGISADEYAELLERKVERLFPTDALSNRLAHVKVSDALDSNIALNALRKLNPGVSVLSKRELDALKMDGLPATDAQKLKSAFDETVRFANRLSGMKLVDVLEDGSLTDAQRQSEVKRRAKLVNEFFTANTDVLAVDLAPGSNESKELKFAAGASDQDKAMVLATARTYQRAMTVTDDVADAEALVAGGLHSALSVAISGPKKLAARTGLDQERSTRYYEKAKHVATAVTARAGTVIDVVRGMFAETAVGNVSTEIAGYLKEIPGFADFFGNQSFCNCKHCQSILGPAAYFVDLMCFVDEKITVEFFADKPDHPLNLKSRRPDLWTLELTCKNTNTPIPYLVIINEILENAVARDAGFSGDFGDRVAVETAVYRDTLPDRVDSFRQPLNLPFEELRSSLRHFEKSLADLAEAGSATGDALARLRLSLPPKDFELITSQTNTDVGFLQTIYGTTFSETGGAIEKFDAQRLLKPMGVSRHELGELVATRFVTESGALDIRIAGEKRSPDSVQNDIENISGVTRAALDRMHRFVRLWRATGWHIGELDLVLSHLEQAGLGTALDAATVRAVAAVHRLQTTRELRVEEAVALWSTVPRHAVLRSLPASRGGDAEAPSLHSALPPLARLTVPLFDRLFNQKSFVEADGAYPKPETAFLHPALASAPPASTDPNLHRLLAATGATEDELLQLILGLARPLGIDPASNVDAQKAFALSERNLTLVYRHARLAKLLKLTLPELFALTALALELAEAHVESLSDLESLFELHAWTSSTDWTLAELVRIYRAARPAIALPPPEVLDSLELAREIVAQVADAESLVFADTVFALLPGLTEVQSRELLRENAALVETVDAARYRLKPGFDPSVPLALPPSIDGALAPALLDTLAAYHSKRLLPALLPSRVNVDASALPHLLAMLGVDVGGDAFFRELRGDVAPAGIASLIDDLRPLGILFKDRSVFDAENLAFVAGAATLFEISDFRSLSTAAVRNIEMFRALLEPWKKRSEPTPDLRAILRTFAAATLFATTDHAELAALLGCDLGAFEALAENLALASRPFEVLGQLLKAVAFVRHVGMAGNALVLAQSASYADLAAASAALQAAFRGKYPEESEWEKKVEPFRDAVLSRRRDGLVAYLVHSGAEPFDEVSDLYHYFLLDVELDGCARTSRVASAIDSVQLYVHRCLMNLEETPPGAPRPAHVLPESIPADEWDWRKNYRVWEANRKIFLYPENYIEPALRDDKTPLFEQLEEELLSKEITDEAILEAYARYLRGFDELAHLTIAGSYHEKDEDARRDVLHLFGVTADEPPIYYYRRVEDAHYGANSDDRSTHWGAWEKMDVQVPTRKVSPIVHKGQLYVFWIRYTTKSKNDIVEGTSTFVGYEHRGYLEFCKRRLDGSWTTPQGVGLTGSPFAEAFFPAWYREDGLIGDPVVTKNDALLGFEVQTNLMGASLRFIADASGRATVSVLGVTAQVQLPPTALNADGPTTVTIDGNEFTVRPVRYGTLETPLYDSQAHTEAKEGYTLSGFGWDRVYPSTGNFLSLRAFNFQMWSPLDLYRLQIGARYEYEDPSDMGVPWIDPGAVVLAALASAILGLNFDLDDWVIDRALWSQATGDRRIIHAVSNVIPCFDRYAFASVLLDDNNVARYANVMARTSPWNRPQWDEDVTDYLASLQRERRLADAPEDASLEVVNGSVADLVIQTSKEALYLQGGVRNDGRYQLRRLSTSLSEDIADILFNRGLDELLATRTQLGFREHPTGMNLVETEVDDASRTDTVDFEGAMGTYLREVFFHIPFLIANHLNSQGRFEDAQKWYHYIFDPTAAESIQGLPAGLSSEERRRRELDRNWRYREFRGLTPDSLRAQLTNDRAIEAYRRDPFNPHAVARLRISAYQKAVIMKYVDNLLDWGDDLFVSAFAQQNQEYLREATLKYVTAQEILGERPAELGDCGESELSPKVFPAIQEALSEASEFLMEIESVIVIRERVSSPSRLKRGMVAVEVEQADRAFVKKRAPAAMGAAEPDEIREAAATITKADLAIARGKTKGRPVTLQEFYAPFCKPKAKWVPKWTVSLVRQFSPIFCVPANERMLAHWDRVEDRLYKLRHCMDINGVFRQLPLFAPPIDPALLVAGRAAGLSLDDILAVAAGTLPPYRFRYLIDKAKAYAATVQAFGAALLGALEKRDAEALARLRNTHQKNMLALTTEVKRSELQIAEESVEVTRRRQLAAQYRFDYYDGLISTGLSPSEITQTAARVASTVASATRLGLATAAGVAHLVPQVGSPFAMKFGGQEIGDSLKAFATVSGIVSSGFEMVATISGIVAGFERREEGWVHQKALAEKDLEIMEREIALAEIRKAIATRSLDLHERSKDQHDEVIDFFEDKFSNLGLYTHLSRTLQQLHREAYNNALAVARLAEHAYRFERPGDKTLFVGGEWEASRSGLLAGERLNLALQTMDRRFIETNARSAEINQSFSLAQIDPQALIELKEIGSAEFALPEFFFDMFYPGHYRRRIRAVRLTIPCITGPYTNVSAKLTLRQSQIRRDAALGATNLLEVPVGGTSTVATSTAQGDAGVFELSFRDERYMPFEGAGAISTWRLELPSQFRPFDYQSINDVILNISYTAEEDGVLRQEVESQNAIVAGSLHHYMSNNSLTRVFSLRQEFSSAFNRLIQAPLGTAVTIDIGERHFPLFLQGRSLNATGADVILSVADRTTGVGAASMTINGTPASAFPAPTNPAAPGDAFGGLPKKSINGAFAAGLKAQHSITVNHAGSLAPAPGGTGALDPDRLRDVLIAVQYRL